MQLCRGQRSVQQGTAGMLYIVVHFLFFIQCRFDSVWLIMGACMPCLFGSADDYEETDPVSIKAPNTIGNYSK